jgi:hypothetical protein
VRWLRKNDLEARRLSERARGLWLEACSREALEQAAATSLRLAPPPEDERFEATLRHVWTRCRAAVYVFVDDRGRLRAFAPFANEAFEGEAPPPSEPAPLAAFLRHVEALHGPEPGLLPPNRWWRNAGLVCNVMPPDVWGESLLPALHLLLSRAARLLAERPSRPDGAFTSARPPRERRQERTHPLRAGPGRQTRGGADMGRRGKKTCNHRLGYDIL